MHRNMNMRRTLGLTIYLLMTFATHSSWAAVTLECNRPTEPVFDHSNTPTREAVVASGNKLQIYSQEVQQYIHCLQAEIIAEKGRLLAVAKRFHEENERLRATLND